MTNDEGVEAKADNKKGEEEGENDKKIRDIAKKNAEEEKRCEKQVKQVENRNEMKKTRQG